MFSPQSSVRVTSGTYKGKSGVVVHETPRKVKVMIDGVTTGLVSSKPFSVPNSFEFMEELAFIVALSS